MQDRYAADVGDFGKFALLEALQGAVGGPLGIVWYKVDNENHNNDGLHIQYLLQPNFHGLNDSLRSQLQRVVDTGRSISNLKKRVALLRRATCFNEVVPTRGREAWFQRALGAMSGKPIVFLDPDNGISWHETAGIKHVSMEEIRALSQGADLIVVYHHFDRSTRHEEQFAERLEQLRTVAREKDVVSGIRFRRGTGRVFMLVARTRRIHDRAQAGLRTLEPWIQRGHFDPPISG